MASTEKKITLALVEDDVEIRHCLNQYLSAQSEFVVDHAVSSVEAFLGDLALAVPPDIILMDIGLPGMSGIDGIKLIKAAHPATEIMMLTIYPDTDKIFDALCAGATGYLLKNTEFCVVKTSILELFAGGAPMSPAIARKVLTQFKPAVSNITIPAKQATVEPLATLTPREQEVVNALVDGLAYKQIAQRLSISLETVRQHIKNIYGKLQVHSKAQVISKVMHFNQ